MLAPAHIDRADFLNTKLYPESIKNLLPSPLVPLHTQPSACSLVIGSVRQETSQSKVAADFPGQSAPGVLFTAAPTIELGLLCNSGADTHGLDEFSRCSGLFRSTYSFTSEQELQAKIELTRTSLSCLNFLLKNKL